MNLTFEIDSLTKKNNLVNLNDDPIPGETVVGAESEKAHDFYKSNNTDWTAQDSNPKKTKHTNFNW
jgi:hypothetical protein